MEEPAIEEESLRNWLKTRRNLLLKEFSLNPSNTSLAIKIRLIDDQIAELTADLANRKKTALHPTRRGLQP